MRDSDVEVIEVINFSDKRTTLLVNIIAGALSGVVAIGFMRLLDSNGYNSLFVLLVAVLMIPGVVIHEYCHYIFQWLFSKKRPVIGFKFPYAYSALSQNSSISRNEAVIVGLAPLLVLSAVTVIPALFLDWLPKVILLSWASVHASLCFGDCFLVFKLVRHEASIRMKDDGLLCVLYRGRI